MTRPTLLCVDDDAAVRELYRILLGSYGYDVIVAENGSHALKMFNPREVDAVILDYEMPGRCGSEVAAEIKRRSPEMPVLMVSGCQSVVEDVPRFVDAALPKGTPVGRLLDKVDNLLGTAKKHLPAKRPSSSLAPLGSALAAVAMTVALVFRLWK